MTVFTNDDFQFRVQINDFIDLDAYMKLTEVDLVKQKAVIDNYVLELKDIEYEDIGNDIMIAIKTQKLSVLEDEYNNTMKKFENTKSDYKYESKMLQKIIAERAAKY